MIAHSTKAVQFLRSETGQIVVIGVIAFAVRAATMLMFDTFNFGSEREMGFEMGEIAASLVSGDGFSRRGEPSAWMPPLYPAMLSVVFWVFGTYTANAAVATLLLQSAASALTGAMIYVLGRQMFGSGVGLVGALIWMLHPGAINYSVRRIWASSFTALGIVTIAFVLLRLREEKNRPRLAALCGLLIGLTALLNPVILIAVPAMVVWYAISVRKDGRRAVAQIAIVVAAAILTTAPWLVRNALVFDKFVPIKGTFGFNLWQGNNPYANHIGAGISPLKTLAPHIPAEELEFLSSLNRVELSDELQSRAIEFISSNPEDFISYTFKRAALFWTIGFRDDSGPWGDLTHLATFFLIGLLIMAAIGIAISGRKLRATSLLVLILATYPIPYYLTIADTYRYRVPLEPLIVVLAAYSVIWIARPVRRRAFRYITQGFPRVTAWSR